MDWNEGTEHSSPPLLCDGLAPPDSLLPDPDTAGGSLPAPSVPKSLIPPWEVSVIFHEGQAVHKTPFRTGYLFVVVTTLSRFQMVTFLRPRERVENIRRHCTCLGKYDFIKVSFRFVHLRNG